MTFKDDSSFWVDVKGRNDKGQVESNGKVRLLIDVMPFGYAEQNKVGEARNEPNVNPFLPPPVGRISFTMNPFKMFVSIISIFHFFYRLKWLDLSSGTRSIVSAA